VRGLTVSIVTTAKTDAEGKALLQALGMPFRARRIVAKTCLRIKAERPPKFKCEATIGARCAAVRAPSSAASGCAGCACAIWRARADSRPDQGELVRTQRCR
jgi:hypothetical protein